VINLGKQSLGSQIWIGFGVRLRFGHEEGDEVTDEWGHGASGTRKKKGCRCSLRSDGPAQSKGRRGGQAVGPCEREFGPRGKQADCWTTGPPDRNSKGKSFPFLFILLYFLKHISNKVLNQFCNPVKTTHNNKINATA
jgi:hypothetical protein